MEVDSNFGLDEDSQSSPSNDSWSANEENIYEYDFGAIENYFNGDDGQSMNEDDNDYEDGQSMNEDDNDYADGQNNNSAYQFEGEGLGDHGDYDLHEDELDSGERSTSELDGEENSSICDEDEGSPDTANPADNTYDVGGGRLSQDSDVKRTSEARSNYRCGCKAKLRVHIQGYSKRWYISLFEHAHNHDVLQRSHAAMLAAHRQMHEADILSLKTHLSSGLTTADVYNSHAAHVGGYNNTQYSLKDLQNQVGKQRRAHVSDGRRALDYLASLGIKDPSMFVRHTEDADKNLEHLFWCDGIGRMNYSVFGDVLAFDATYKKNKYRRPLVIFSCVNHHNQTTVVGGAVIGNENEETYVWLLEQLLEAMDKKSPTAVITDGDKAMKNAIRRVFPNASHRLCAWHLMCNATDNIKIPDFLPKFKTCMFGDFQIGDFKRKWESLVEEFNLHEHPWIIDMYARRHTWAAAYFRGKFFAGFRTTSRCEGFNAQLGKFVKRRYNLKEFLQHFHRCLEYMRHREVEADFRSGFGDPGLKAPPLFQSIELSASRILTRQLFFRFRPTIVSAADMIISNCEDTLGMSMYTVKRSQESSREWLVSYYTATYEFRCSCMRMESIGLACAHIIAVLVDLNIHNIPKSLVLERWSQGAKDHLCETPGSSPSLFRDSAVLARYVCMLEACRKMCTLACPLIDDFRQTWEIVGGHTQHLENKNNPSVPEGVTGTPSANAGLTTHRRRGRPRGPSTSRLRAKRPLKCSACKVIGHNRLTCPLVKGTSTDGSSTGGDHEFDDFEAY
ncbi:protein FAR1-RELATED SEQUENCE 5-like [Lotus japonicus]|uniref:protein FAR1-RELATED SEQUENCE 5-like n=1 Tax=Lotus japonicus TaxID=34305 RepID=UPI00258DDEC8|nr:protein FAR1-RELATED SEQUENCE 5-like [Lotus japonicus]